MNSKKTLYGIVITSVISVVTIIMTVMIYYSYITTKNKLINEFKVTSQETLTRLSISIAPFISSYSVNEYEKLVLNEMNTKEIYAIVVEDYITGSIINKKAYVSGKLRDKNWNIIEYEESKKFKHEYFFMKEEVIDSEGQTLGKLKIFYTDKFLNEELRDLIKNFLFVLLAISISLILLLFLILKVFILKPIKDIMNSITDKDKDGLPKNIHLKDSSKEISLLSLTMRNMVSRVKESQQKIKELNERFTLTLEALKDGIWDWDIKANKVYLSKQWKAMLGYERDELENKKETFFELVHIEDKHRVEEALEEHFKDPIKNPYNVEVRLKCKDGSYKWILSRGKVTLDENGNPIRMLGSHADISEEKKNEEHLKEQEKIMNEQSKLVSMGEMIGNIAHQWRQPLSVISTGATGLRIEKEFGTLKDEEFYKTCDLINDNAQYLSKTIDDFKGFVKGERKLSRFNLTENIESFLHLVEGAIKNNGIKLIKELDDDIELYSYPHELMQCFINIFNNSKDALKGIKKGRLIFISTRKEGENIIIEFKDNAGGIPDEILPHIFEPYFTTKHQSQGTGLGLSMTHTLITKGIGGSIDGDNITFNFEDKEYKGALFKIVISLNEKA